MGSDGKLWKLIVGDESQYVETGEYYPNITTGTFDSQAAEYVRHCGYGCLFEIRGDPLEQTDLAADMPEKVDELRKRTEQYVLTSFNPNRGKPQPAACAAAEAYGGFWGPWVDVAIPVVANVITI